MTMTLLEKHTMDKKHKGIPPSGIFRRGGKLLKLGGKLLKDEMSQKISQWSQKNETVNAITTRKKQIEEAVMVLTELKGAALKTGQFLSIELSDLLPKEVSSIIAKLHQQSQFMPYSEVEAILHKELGSEKISKIRDLDSIPLGAASIGQVHRASIDGRQVAIKIQFPDIAKSVDSDILLVKSITSSILKILGKKIDLDDTFREVKSILKKELDYLREADSMTRYRENFIRDERFIVPTVMSEFCSKRVLTMTFEEGVSVSHLLESDNAQKEDIDYFGNLLLELLIREFFDHALVQTDPNYGNFLFQLKEKKLVLLDFGATKKYSQALIKNFRKLAQLSYEGKQEELIILARKMKILDEKESDNVEELFVELMESIICLFRQENQPTDFGNLEALDLIRQNTRKYVAAVKHTSPAKDLLFLNRKLGGIYHLLKDMSFRGDLYQYYKMALD